VAGLVAEAAACAKTVCLVMVCHSALCWTATEQQRLHASHQGEPRGGNEGL
jgi:hypothetical protein